MTILITVLAAIVSTVAWYVRAPADAMKVSALCHMYWGASLMWLVDAAFQYAEQGAAFFKPSTADMLNDAFLGFSAVVLGLAVWLAILLAKDPRGVFHRGGKAA